MTPDSVLGGLPASLMGFPGAALEPTLRTFAAVWAEDQDAESLWLLEYPRDVRLVTMFGEFAEANAEVLTTQREGEYAARRVAETAVRLRDDVLAIVAHDLRNPLDRIVASSSMLSESLAEESRVQLISVIARTATGMNRLLSDLLDASSIEAGRLHIDLQLFDITALVENTVDIFVARAAARDPSFTWTTDGTLREVWADAGRMQQVIVHLRDKAVRTTARAGAFRSRLDSSATECSSR